MVDITSIARESLAAKDMYADLEKIEARGKRKKEKSKGFFSFGNKDEPEQEEVQSTEPVQTPAPEPIPQPTTPKPAPPKVQPVAQAPQPAKTQVVHHVEPPKPAHQPARTETHTQSSWKPLTGSKLSKAEEDLVIYKKWLNKGYKSGMLTKEQCSDMVRDKEIELGLRPPE